MLWGVLALDKSRRQVFSSKVGWCENFSQKKSEFIDLFFLEKKIIIRNQQEDIKAITQISQRSLACSVSWILMFM